MSRGNSSGSQTRPDVRPSRLILQLRSIEVDGRNIAAAPVDGELERIRGSSINCVGTATGSDAESRVGYFAPKG